MVKDAFCNLSNDHLAITPLFEAAWIWRAPQADGLPDGWEVVGSQDGLAAWEAAWARAGNVSRTRVFPPALLTRKEITVLGRRGPTGFDAGAILNASQDCMGLSNVFGPYGAAVAAAAAHAGGQPLVGYEAGDDLRAARRAGFETVGRLAVVEITRPLGRAATDGASVT